MYQAANPGQGAEGFDPNNMGNAGANTNNANTKNDDNVVDADFKVDDEK